MIFEKFYVGYNAVIIESKQNFFIIQIYFIILLDGFDFQVLLDSIIFNYIIWEFNIYHFGKGKKSGGKNY